MKISKELSNNLATYRKRRAELEAERDRYADEKRNLSSEIIDAMVAGDSDKYTQKKEAQDHAKEMVEFYNKCIERLDDNNTMTIEGIKTIWNTRAAVLNEELEREFESFAKQRDKAMTEFIKYLGAVKSARGEWIDCIGYLPSGVMSRLDNRDYNGMPCGFSAIESRKTDEIDMRNQFGTFELADIYDTLKDSSAPGEFVLSNIIKKKKLICSR